MLIQRQISGVVLVDVQEKLTPYVLNVDQLKSRCAWILRLAQALNVPITINEQYPCGLGETISELKQSIKDYAPLDKTTFSCCRNDKFVQHWQALNKKHMIIIGIEAHVCVLQTAIEALKLPETEVFVVVDAVSSRSNLDYKYALKRMQQAGVHLVTSEMVFFEWVEQAGTPDFKRLSKEFLK